MGKGGTKFESEAIKQRSSNRRMLSGKEMRKDMDKYLQTGVHPEVQRLQEVQRAAVPLLPDKDVHRPHVFMDLKAGNKELGRLVVEVFEEVAPLAARHFLNRCREGTADSFQGTVIHKSLAGVALFGGNSRGHKDLTVKLKSMPKLRHVEAGVVSISLSGNEFAITYSRALVLDESHQVIGRVILGSEAVQQVQDMERDEDDAPVPKIKLVRCGLTNSKGTHESLDDAGMPRKSETPEEAAARLKAESAAMRDTIRDALQTGLSSKRKAEECDAPPRPHKRSIMDTMLGDLSEGTSSQEGSES